MGIRKSTIGNVNEILKSKNLYSDVTSIIAELENGWIKGLKGLKFQKEILNKYDWDTEHSVGIPNRRYSYDGYKDKVAIEIEWNQMEKILTDLMKFEYGYKKGIIDLGIIVNPGDRGERSPIPSDESGGEVELQEMGKIIEVPVILAVLTKKNKDQPLFNLTIHP